jgi:hypothetical protein
MTKEKENKSHEQEVFKLKKEIIELSFRLDTERHSMKMKELAFIRETDKIRHDQENERQRIQRIKSAEIRRTQLGFNDKRDFQRYSR